MIKKLLLAVFVSTVLTSCTYYKVATVTSGNAKLINNNVVFENDSVKITYNFWAKNGTMTFDIYNKLSVPIYFDWKKSAFIPNDKMMSYWQDETNTTGTSASSAYYLYGGAIAANSKTKTKSIRQERVGVVPPRSLITSKKYSLVPPKTKWTAQSYDLSTTPLRFRNYLAISPFEQFDKDVFYLDNEFFVSDVRNVKKAKIKSAQSGATFYLTEQ